MLVALTEDINSVVTAYLLQRQGYQVSGLGIVFRQGLDEEKSAEKESLEKIKALCEKLGMAFYAADASMLYEHAVVDPLVASRLEGVAYSFKIYIAKVVFDLLAEKADYLGIPWVATGHYARIIKNQKTGNYSVYTAKDVSCDQSYFLSLLDQKILKRMLLPLANMRKSEVVKVAKNLGVDLPIFYKFDYIFEHKEALNTFIGKRIPTSMIKEGTVVNYNNGNVVQQHQGIHHFTLGEDNLKIQSDPPLSSEMQVCQIDTQSGIVYLLRPDDYQIKYLWIKNIVVQDQFDISKPIDAFIKFRSDGELLPAVLYFKNNAQILLEFANIQRGIVFAGNYCVAYNTDKQKSRILFGGVVERAGNLLDGAIRALPERERPPEEEKAKVRRSLFGSGLKH